MNNNEYMNEAYKEALIAYNKGEYPVGAVLVKNYKIISRSGNKTNIDYDPTAHAEIVVIRDACKKLECITRFFSDRGLFLS